MISFRFTIPHVYFLVYLVMTSTLFFLYVKPATFLCVHEPGGAGPGRSVSLAEWSSGDEHRPVQGVSHRGL